MSDIKEKAMTLSLAAIGDNLDAARSRYEQVKGRMGVVMDTHLLVEIWQSPFSTLADAKVIEQALYLLGQGAVERDGQEAHDLEVRVHQFNPYGVSGTAKTPSAHVLIHTWPENKYAAVDIYANGRENAYSVLENIKKGLDAGYVQVTELHRGELLEIEDT